MNILIQYNATGSAPWYKGIYYNCTNNFIYVAPFAFNVIQVFDLNLILNHTFSTATYKPWSIGKYNNKMYVGTYTGTILVLEDEVIINTFNGCNGDSVQLTQFKMIP